MPKGILIADNEQESSLLFKKAFNELKLSGEVQFVQNGFQVFSRLDSISDKETLPALIILDGNMQSLSGIETLTRLKENVRYKSIPVIIYTSSANNNDKNKYMQLGAVDYLAKPKSPEHYSSAARSLYNLALSKR
jgi:CheY-like chemotaxis protein